MFNDVNELFKTFFSHVHVVISEKVCHIFELKHILLAFYKLFVYICMTTEI